MAKRNQTMVSKPSIDDQIDAARGDLIAARQQADVVAAEENDNLASDEVYSSWQRRRRLADLEVSRRTKILETLQADRAAQIARDERARYTARWEAAAARNRDVAEMMKQELPKAWDIIKAVLQAAAVAEIETERVLRDRPSDFDAPCAIGDPEAFRCRRSVEEEILEDKVVDLFVDKQTGRIFADQSNRRPHSVVRQFREITYLPMRLGDATLPFHSELRFPRLDDNGPAFFDGSKLKTPHDVLRALRTPRPERLQRQRQVRIEPIASASAAKFDGGPAVVT